MESNQDSQKLNYTVLNWLNSRLKSDGVGDFAQTFMTNKNISGGPISPFQRTVFKSRNLGALVIVNRKYSNSNTYRIITVHYRHCNNGGHIQYSHSWLLYSTVKKYKTNINNQQLNRKNLETYKKRDTLLWANISVSKYTPFKYLSGNKAWVNNVKSVQDGSNHVISRALTTGCGNELSSRHFRTPARTRA